jgi:acetyl-CoA C-acetyltransferase
VAHDVDPRTPVLVGVGTCLDDAEAAELMVRAARAAADEAGPGASLLQAIERITVPRGTWSYTDPGRIVAERVGATVARTHLVDLGIPQQTLINQALAAILAGEIEVALVVGAEAKARAARAAGRSSSADSASMAAMGRRAGAPGVAKEIDQGGAEPDVHQVPEGELVSPAEIEAGLLAPVQQYALIESALRAHEGRSVEEHRREIGALWARMNEVARSNPEAAFPQPLTAADLAGDAAGRPLAFPYRKWHASQWTVDQAAALLLCSAAAAERHGVPRDRWLFPLVALDSSHGLPLLRRRELHRWPAMGVLGAAAEAHLGRSLRTVEHVELYSCFPAAVRVQQRELGLPLDGTPTVTGGMAFAGGPFNNFVLQATAAIARRLRARPGLGLVTTVSGFLTKPGLAVWSSAPGERPLLVADLAIEVEAATGAVGEAVGRPDGAGTIAALTITFAGDQPLELVAILDADDDRAQHGGAVVGTRLVARSRDAALVARGMAEELIGRRFATSGGELRS